MSVSEKPTGRDLRSSSRWLEGRIHQWVTPVLGILARRPFVSTLLLLLVSVGLAAFPVIDPAGFRAVITGTGAEFALREQQDLLDSPLFAQSVTLRHMDALDLAGPRYVGAEIERVELDGPESLARMASRASRARGTARAAGVVEADGNDTAGPPATMVGSRGLQFGELRVGAGSTIRLAQSADEEAVELTLLAGTWRGTVWLDSVLVRAFDGSGGEVSSPDREKPLGGDAPPGLGPSITFADTIAGATAEEPSRIRLRQATAWRMTPNMQAAGFSFWDEEQGGHSMIQDGTIWIAEAGGARTDLRNGDRIELGGVVGHVHDLRVAESIHLRISGDVMEAKLEQRNLRTAYLIRAYHWEPLRIILALFAGLATILCGYELVAPGGGLRGLRGGSDE